MEILYIACFSNALIAFLCTALVTEYQEKLNLRNGIKGELF